ncbi:MAG: hypothetical protein NWP95_04370 [Pontimonas sp.]|nr:hypothetical protein [Pontimonas sp.]
MGVAKTLWEILDHQQQEPAILDSRDAGTSNHFAKARPFRWKVGMRAALEILEASGTTPLRSDERGIVTVSSTATGKLTIWSER